MNIVIPMAGRGKRFADVGYKEPKPFIDVKGKPMIEQVLYDIIDRNPSASFAKFTFLCLEDFLTEYGERFKKILQENNITPNIISVKSVTEGAACTVLLAKDIIDNDQELIITDCDHIVLDPGYIGRGLSFFRHRKADGGLWCFLNNDPKWSYVDVHNAMVEYVAEKSVISNIANTGTYYFAKGSTFVKHAEKMIRLDHRSKNEFYVAPVYNELSFPDYKILPFMVNDMVGLGTPEDLEKFLSENP